MRDSERYRTHAEEMERRAAAATSEDERKSYEEIAEAWWRLAKQAQAAESAGD